MLGGVELRSRASSTAASSSTRSNLAPCSSGFDREIGGEVATAVVHPFNSRRSWTLVLPALGRLETAVEIMWATMVVTWTTDEQHDIAIRSVRNQLAFYGSTPAYAPVLDIHGYGDLHGDLNAMSKAGRWAEMATLIPDDLIDQLAVIGPRADIARKISARTQGITDHVSLVNNRNPDPQLLADIVEDLRGLSPR